jgi:hypothetical protein
MNVAKSKIILLCLGIFIFVSQSFGQANGFKKFDSVPVPIRESLIERLNLFLEYERTDQYEKKYDMFSDYTKTVLWKRKGDYVKFQQDRKTGVIKRNLTFNITKLISFNIKSVEDKSIDDTPDFRRFDIKGTVIYLDGKKNKKKDLLMQTTFEKGDWYFSDWLEEKWSYD